MTIHNHATLIGQTVIIATPDRQVAGTLRAVTHDSGTTTYALDGTTVVDRNGTATIQKAS